MRKQVRFPGPGVSILDSRDFFCGRASKQTAASVHDSGQTRWRKRAERRKPACVAASTPGTAAGGSSWSSEPDCGFFRLRERTGADANTFSAAFTAVDRTVEYGDRLSSCWWGARPFLSCVFSLTSWSPAVNQDGQIGRMNRSASVREEIMSKLIDGKIKVQQHVVRLIDASRVTMRNRIQ